MLLRPGSVASRPVPAMPRVASNPLLLRLRLRLRAPSAAAAAAAAPAAAATAAPAPACPVCLRETLLAEERVAPCARGCALCAACLRAYLKTAADARRWPVPCVSCGEPLDGRVCVEALEGEEAAQDVMERVLLEREFHGERVRFCCNPNCSAPFEFVEAEDPVRETEYGGRVVCPLCGVDQCVRCGRVEHAGRRCEGTAGGGGGAAGRAGDADGSVALAETAAVEGWRRCPGCDSYTSRDVGCNYCVCKCGVAFCFRCGVEYRSRHRHRPGANVHGVPGCRCSLYDG
jgi:E3 ubiquitin-protein ligase RNF144